jgi:hypothetical protein
MRFTRTTTSIAVGAGLVLITASATARADPIVWNGPPISFTKLNHADYTLPINQDRLTDHVWLTRLNARPLINIFVEDYPQDFLSPLDTEWAFGPTQPGNPGPITASNFRRLEFSPFAVALNRAIGAYVLQYGPGVLHLISDDTYVNIRFTSWTSGDDIGGGGFSYIRSTPGETPVPEPSSASLLIAAGMGWLGRAAVRRARREARLVFTTKSR